MRFRSIGATALPTLTACLLLAACEGQMTLDLQADAPGPDGVLTLKLDGVELTHSDGNVERVSLDRELRIDADGLAPTRLLDGTELRDGDYTALALRIDPAASLYDADGDGEGVALRSTNTTPAATNLSVAVREDDTAQVTLHLASFASLPAPAEDAPSTQLFTGRLRAGRTSDSYGLTLTLTAPEILSDQCSGLSDRLPRLYLYAGRNALLDDVDGGSNDPLRVVHARELTSTTSDREWALSRVPGGGYRVALSCGDDDPALDETLVFFCSADFDLSEDRSLVLQDASGEDSCL